MVVTAIEAAVASRVICELIYVMKKGLQIFIQYFNLESEFDNNLL